MVRMLIGREFSSPRRVLRRVHGDFRRRLRLLRNTRPYSYSPFYFEVSLDDIARQRRRQGAVLTALVQDGDHDLGISAGSQADEPGLVAQIILRTACPRRGAL